ncbi:MAG: hypothetical protein ABIA11_01625 [Patescibacteria group bacterium]
MARIDTESFLGSEAGGKTSKASYFYCDRCGSWNISREDVGSCLESFSSAVVYTLTFILLPSAIIATLLFLPLGIVLWIILILVQLMQYKGNPDVQRYHCTDCGYSFGPLSYKDIVAEKYHGNPSTDMVWGGWKSYSTGVVHKRKDIPENKKPDYKNY